MRKRRMRKQEEKRNSKRHNASPLTEAEISTHNQSILHNINESTRRSARKAPRHHRYILVTRSLDRSSSLRVTAQLRSPRLRIRRRTNQRRPALQNHAHRRLHQQIAQPPFVREGLHEGAILELLQNLWSNAAAHVHAACRQHLQRQIPRLGSIRTHHNVQRLRAEGVLPSLAHL